MITCSTHEAAEFLKADNVVCFPTETLYGLAVNPASEIAVEKLLSMKERQRGQGISLILDSSERVQELHPIETPLIEAERKRLQDLYWPGPLTIVLRVNQESFPLSKALLGPENSIAVRVSSHPIARECASLVGGFITATSANLRSQKPLVEHNEIRAVFPHMPIVEGECLDPSLESTILDVRSSPPKILRQGAVLFK